MSFLSYAGSRAVSGTLTMPFTGVWVADLLFAEDTELTAGANPLVCGDLTLTGTVFRQHGFAAQRSARIVGGYGGWLRTLQARSYTLPGGVSRNMVLRDAASEAGERLTLTDGDHVVGDYFIREAAQAQRVLRQLVGNDWYVDIDGTTRVQARTSARITGEYLIQSFSPALGELVISTEDYAQWLPGNTFSNALIPDAQTVSLVRIESDNDGKLRHTILTTGPGEESDRVMSPLRQMIRSELPILKFLGTYSYVVSASDGTSVTCQPANPAIGLPSMVKIPLRAGVAGMSCKPKPGTRLAVGFLDASPAQPYIAGGFDLPPVSKAVVCYGDTIALSVSGGGIVSGAAELTRTVQAEFP